MTSPGANGIKLETWTGIIRDLYKKIEHVSKYIEIYRNHSKSIPNLAQIDQRVQEFHGISGFFHLPPRNNGAYCYPRMYWPLTPSASGASTVPYPASRRAAWPSWPKAKVPQRPRPWGGEFFHHGSPTEVGGGDFLHRDLIMFEYVSMLKLKVSCLANLRLDLPSGFFLEPPSHFWNHKTTRTTCIMGVTRITALLPEELKGAEQAGLDGILSNETMLPRRFKDGVPLFSAIVSVKRRSFRSDQICSM